MLTVTGYSKQNLKIHTGPFPSPSPPFPSFPVPLLPSHLSPSPLPLEVDPLNAARGRGSLPQRGLGGAPAEIDFGAFSLII